MPKKDTRTMEEKIADVQAEIAHYRAENALLAKIKRAERKKTKPEVRFKVSDKGAISVYLAFRLFPVTLYVNEWEELFPVIDKLKAFAAENEPKLKRPVEFDPAYELEKLRGNETRPAKPVGKQHLVGVGEVDRNTGESVNGL